MARLLDAAWPKLIDVAHRDHADLRCAILMLAAERLRKAQGHWPQNVDELALRVVAKVPIDPFDGKPLRMVRTEDGLILYSVGEDGVDNGGKLSDRPNVAGTDCGLRLWDAPGRRQPPKPQDESEKP
jgi:hypothetical protein